MKTKAKDTGKTMQRYETGFFDEMDRAFDAFMHRGWLRPFRDLWPETHPFRGMMDIEVPRVDVIDRDTELVVKAEVPGIDKKDLHVDLTGNMLTIEGRREHKEETEEGNLYRAEIARGGFSRTLQLPEAVQLEKAEATFKDGLLTIRLPKVEETKRQRIEVK
jgi:HSP20 family protein